MTNHTIIYPEPTGCYNFMLVGHPRFIDIISNPSSIFIIKFILATIATATSFIVCLKELSSIKRYDDRFLLRLTQILTTIPWVLCTGAYVTFISPRLLLLIKLFDNTYFSIALFGFAKLIFNYFGSVRLGYFIM